MNERKRVFKALKSTGLPVAQDTFGDYLNGDKTNVIQNALPKLPYIIFSQTGELVLLADDERYITYPEFEVSLYEKTRNDKTEQAIELALEQINPVFDRAYNYSPDMGCHVVTYSFQARQ